MRAITRRSMLKGLAGCGTGIVILRNGLSAHAYAANEKVNVALIGVGGRGSWFVQTMPKQSNVVALCDVNESKATAAYKALPEQPKFHDFREMLEKMDKEIEAVVVATPDHIHAPASVRAMRMGKHVFCEKPLTHTIHEARVMGDVSREKKVATQMGNQGSSSPQFRRGVELIEDGALGDIKQVFVYKDGAGPGNTSPPEGAQKIPDYLKWDLWLGPAAARPFHPKWMAWSGWRDFGTSTVGMWGSHSTYLAFTALKVGSLWTGDPKAPPLIKVKGTAESINKLAYPRWELVHIDIPARGKLPPVRITWSAGKAPGSREQIEERLGKKLDWGDAGEKKWADHAGAAIIGEKGVMHLNGHNTSFSLIPAEPFAGLQQTKPERLSNSHGHEQDWLLACKGGPLPLSNFGLTGPYLEMLLLIHVATLFDQELKYDPVNGKIVNCAEADAAIRPPYREGWTL